MLVALIECNLSFQYLEIKSISSLSWLKNTYNSMWKRIMLYIWELEMLWDFLWWKCITAIPTDYSPMHQTEHKSVSHRRLISFPRRDLIDVGGHRATGYPQISVDVHYSNPGVIFLQRSAGNCGSDSTHAHIHTDMHTHTDTHAHMHRHRHTHTHNVTKHKIHSPWTMRSETMTWGGGGGGAVTWGRNICCTVTPPQGEAHNTTHEQ